MPLKRTKVEAKAKVVGGLRVRVYQLLDRCVDEGWNYGWMRAHKHTDSPDVEALKQEVCAAIMSAIMEYFDVHEGES